MTLFGSKEVGWVPTLVTLFGSKEVSWGPGWFFMVPGWFFCMCTVFWPDDPV